MRFKTKLPEKILILALTVMMVSCNKQKSDMQVVIFPEWIHYEGQVTEGYTSAISGTHIYYPSFTGDQKDALIVRSNKESGSIAWHLPVVQDVTNSIVFVLEAGMAKQLDGRFELAFNGTQIAVFSDTSIAEAQEVLYPDVKISFLRLRQDMYGDNFGFLLICIPNDLIRKNEKQRMSIAAKDRNSNSWMMLFREKQATKPLLRLYTDGLLLYPASVSYAQSDDTTSTAVNKGRIWLTGKLGQEVVIRVIAEDGRQAMNRLRLLPGLNTADLEIPYILTDQNVRIEYELEGRTLHSQNRFSPVVPVASLMRAPFRFPKGMHKQSPIPDSERYSDLEFSGRYRNYTNADTWYPTWADDDHLYAPWTDGYILDAHTYEAFDGSHPGYACNSLDLMGRAAATAQARIKGTDPLDLRIDNLPPRVEASPEPFGGRYPCGSLIHDGIWYYGTYCLTNNPDTSCGGVGWSQFGPFVGFRYSEDFGKTWQETPHTPSDPLFDDEKGRHNIRFGAPHFVDFGKNMTYSPDGYAYLVAHGSTDPLACTNWIQGDDIYLARVKPSIKTINDAEAYEFYKPESDGTPGWTNDFADMKPILSWPGELGCVTVSYNAPLGKYLMCITRGKTAITGNTIILEADALTGPWKMIRFLEDFGPFAYFVNIPTKFISGDGHTFWLCYSANFNDKISAGHPVGSFYALSLHEVSLIGK